MSYIDFDYYKNVYNGFLDEETFDSLSKASTLLVTQFMEQYIAPWCLKKSIEDYPCDMRKAICYQIDYLESFRGQDILNLSGPTDFDIKSIKTEGFEYSYDEETLKERTMYVSGVPFSIVASNLIKKELRINGLMCRKV